ncbi:MAG: hypothetical protein BroJett011_76730 [Chloroflexota bacterium]|nr:MAG: hypothetical protein BroJett011_76730 [Chloroflexota bacterium]
MHLLKIVSKQRSSLFLIIFAVLLVSVMSVILMLMQPYILYLFATKAYVNYEINLLKYPNSHFLESETKATSKVTMATDYTYRTSDNIDTVREYMEQQIPGFVHLQGVRVVKEPTYVNSSCADETVLKLFFQLLDKGSPCIEIRIYPADTGETWIIISEHWFSAGVASWLRWL